eukprot:1341204-Pleurochrysis_carterae.AAC.1
MSSTRSCSTSSSGASSSRQRKRANSFAATCAKTKRLAWFRQRSSLGLCQRRSFARRTQSGSRAAQTDFR